MAEITSAEPAAGQKMVSFRWRYIIMPAVLLLLTVIIVAVLFPKLPAEAAYHFNDGAPDRWVGRGVLTAWAVGLQAVMLILGLMAVGVAVAAGRQLEETRLTRQICFIMGNIVVLPQLIFIFAILDIFLYNIYQIRLIPLWVFILIVAAAGGLFLAVFFLKAFRQTRRQSGKSLQE